MKNLFAFIILIVLIPAFARAQSEMMKVSEAYNYLKTQSDLISGKFLIKIYAGETNANKGLFIDYATGTSIKWIFTFTLKDSLVDSVITYTIFKNSGKYIIDSSSGLFGKYYYLPKMDTNFIDSDIIGKNVSNNAEFMKYYYQSEVPQLIRNILINYSEKYQSTVWIVSEYVSVFNKAECIYNGLTGDIIECNFPTSITSNDLTNETNAFPNPASDNIRIEAPITGNSDIQIYDNLGNIVKSDKIYFENFADIDVSGLPAGVYMLKILNGSSLITKKISIMR